MLVDNETPPHTPIRVVARMGEGVGRWFTLAFGRLVRLVQHDPNPMFARESGVTRNTLLENSPGQWCVRTMHTNLRES